MGHLESTEISDDLDQGPFRLPVQWVNRPNLDFRGYAGLISGGSVRPGDRVRILPSARESAIASIVGADGVTEQAIAGQSVTVTLTDEIDVSRGDVIVSASEPPGVADQFQCHLVWMASEPMLPGRPYLLKIGTRTVTATIAQLRYQVNVNTLEHTAARTLEMNGIGVCHINLDRRVPFDAYSGNRDMGGFILIDRYTNGTVAAGLLDFALRRSDNLHWQAVEVDKAARARHKHQQPGVVWFTGLSGAGKSTIANLVEKKLHQLGYHTYMLDGDNVRHGLNKDLGFTDADRVENIRRVAEVARLLVDAGLIVLASFISPFHAERQLARELLGDGEFIEVHVDTPLAVAEARDRKGLYAKARRGEIANFTGIDSPYEPPESPELRLDASGTLSADASADLVVAHLRQAGLLDSPDGA
jgi:bifunctional enzyme CysN/CysC